MRSLQLLAAAAEAEGIRLRRTAAATARSVVMFAVAGVFAVALLIMLHLAGYSWLEPRYGAALAALMVAGADLLLALIFVLVGRPGHDPVAAEALEIRRRSLAEAAEHPLAGAFDVLPWRRHATHAGGAIAERAIRAVARR
ncbi:MAG: phage holin family protein [Acetobacteraceae bacterium]|nr:phage holin family protein [Acetobacteraceae bacterium]